MTARVLFVGWDGGDWAVLDRLAAMGLLPALTELRKRGIEGELRSTFPPHSVAAWTSFLTGLPPEHHGIVDFTRCRPGLAFPDAPFTSRDVPAPTLLDALSGQGLRVFAANIPMTYPPRPLNGALISGVFLPKGARYTYPSDLQDRLETLGGFPVNAMRWDARDGDLGSLLLEAKQAIHRRTQTFLHMLSEEPWDVALVAYMAPDRLQHPAMHLLDPGHPLHEERTELIEPLHAAFRDLDAALAALLDAAEPDEIVLASDHGFRPVARDMVPNRVLESLGYLRFRRGSQGLRRTLGPAVRRIRAFRGAARTGHRVGLDWSRTVAYAPSVASQGIRLNVADRDPFGSLDPARFDAMVDRLIQDLRGISGPGGRPAFARVFAAEDERPGLSDLPGMPDVLYEPGPYLGLTGSGAAEFQPVGRKTGEHRVEGIVVRSGTGPLPEGIWDVPGFVMSLTGADGPWPGGDPLPLGATGAGGIASDRDERHILEQLANLGYID